MKKKQGVKLGIIIGIPIIIVIIAVLCLIIFSALQILGINPTKIFDPNKNNYDHSIFVVTKDQSNDEIRYYEVNDYEYKRKVMQFSYEDNKYIKFDKCFDSYIDKNARKVLNKRLDECKLLDGDGNEISIDDTYNDIINQVSNLEHDIVDFESKIFRTENSIYVVIEFNVNLWTPYKLYKYDNHFLNRVYTFDGEDVIAIKEK